MARVAGDVVRFDIENSPREENVDHVYAAIDAGLQAPVTLSLNTLSFRNRVAGHDPRIRLGILRWRWTHLPPRGLYPLEFFDYDTVEYSEKRIPATAARAGPSKGRRGKDKAETGVGIRV